MKVNVFWPLNWSSLPQQAFQTIQLALTQIAGSINNPDNGVTSSRPSRMLVVGQPYFDRTLGIPIWWNGSQWVNASGTPV